MAVCKLTDNRPGKNTQHNITALLRQSMYSRLAGYEDTNDAERLSVDPAMRHVVGKRATDKTTASVSYIVTNLLWKRSIVGKFYNKLGTAEQWIKQGKYASKWIPLSCHDSDDNQVRLQLFAMAYNIGNFLRRLALNKSIKDGLLRTMREKLAKIGAKVVSHTRHATFQMAEV